MAAETKHLAYAQVKNVKYIGELVKFKVRTGEKRDTDEKCVSSDGHVNLLSILSAGGSADCALHCPENLHRQLYDPQRCVARPTLVPPLFRYSETWEHANCASI